MCSVIFSEIIDGVGFSTPRVGGGSMTVYETLSLMITFGILLVAILSFRK